MMNRFSILALLTLLFTINNLRAQDLKFGVGAGLNLVDGHLGNSANSNYQMTVDPKPGFNINGIISYHWNERWSIAVEPGYIQRGYKYNLKEAPQSLPPFDRTKHSITLHYLQLPVIASYRFHQNFSASAGLEVSHWLDSDLVAYTWEYSGAIGFNYHYADSWSFGMKYNHGISPAFSLSEINDNGEYLGELKLYNQYLQLMVKYTI